MNTWVNRLLPAFFMCLFLLHVSADAADTLEADEVPEGTRFGAMPGFSAREVMEAFALAYPQRVEKSGLHGGDWGVRIDGEWFLYAGGRLLPASVALDPGTDLSGYAPYPFYRYTKQLPLVRKLSAEERQRLEARLSGNAENPPRRHPGLYNALWRMDSREEAWERMKTAFFLGKKILIHRDLLEDFAVVEEEILDLADANPQVRAYVDSIAGTTGFNYRPIAGTDTLSFHSYGLAVDLTPQRYGGREVYWRWAWENNPEWFSLPYEKRYMVPLPVVDIWERHGFIWGGKWFFFDAMHFEYRPEILILNGIR
ncbi:MAG: M15 family metallopeptidase [Spirochaetales bacterium]|nr:M15 family metallopeptidase [Spirochaetales bacterium]